MTWFRVHGDMIIQSIKIKNKMKLKSIVSIPEFYGSAKIGIIDYHQDWLFDLGEPCFGFVIFDQGFLFGDTG